jgi:DNA-directed RNA polymerase specialized sigma24 family protein
MGAKRQGDEASSDAGPVLTALIALLGHRSSPDQDDALMAAIVSVMEREMVAREAVGGDMSDSVARRYALRMVHNKLIDEWRRRARHVELRREPAAPGATENSPAEDNGARMVVDALWAELQPDDRTLLEAYLTDRDQYRVEAQRQKYTTTSARARVFSLLKRLRDEGRRLR